MQVMALYCKLRRTIGLVHLFSKAKAEMQMSDEEKNHWIKKNEIISDRSFLLIFLQTHSSLSCERELTLKLSTVLLNSIRISNERNQPQQFKHEQSMLKFINLKWLVVYLQIKISKIFKTLLWCSKLILGWMVYDKKKNIFEYLINLLFEFI